MQSKNRTGSIPLNSKPEILPEDIVRTSSSLSQKKIQSSDGAKIDNSEAGLLSFDDILNDMGFGKYQMLVFATASAFSFIHGMEGTILSLLINNKDAQWHFNSKNEMMVFGVLVYISYFIGSMLVGPICDKFGRKKPLIITAFFMNLFGLLSSLALDVLALIFLRVLYHIFVGFTYIVSYALLTEFSPKQNRGKLLNATKIIFIFGELFACLLAFLALKNLEKGNWPALLGYSNIAHFFGLIFAIFFIDESARFYLQKNKHAEAFQVISKMALLNLGSSNYFDEQKRLQLVNWAVKHHPPHIKTRKVSGGISKQIKSFFKKIGHLFHGDLLKITPIIWFYWFINLSTYALLSFMIPYTLDTLAKREGGSSSGKGLRGYLEVNAIELLSGVVLFFIADIKWFGRKNSLIITSVIAGLMAIALLSEPKREGFLVWVGLFKFVVFIPHAIIYLYTSEIYPTNLRATGLGMGNSIGRIGGTFVPWIGIFLADSGAFLPYVLFASLLGIAGLMLCLIKIETMNMDLDNVQSEKQEEPMRDKKEVNHIQLREV